MNAQRKTIESLAQLKQIYAKINSSRSEMHEAEEELKKLDSTFNKQALEELNAINSQLLEIHHTIQRLTELNKNLVVKAPIRGIIKGLTVTPGSVISPGSNIFDIIPTGGEMGVSCKISTRDIGHIHLGDPAQVKVMAYEFTRYGSVDGKVTEISASTFTGPDNLPYYKAKVSLLKNYVGDNPKLNQLKPGMTVQVDIKTGKKSLISYLLQPITRGLSTSFKER
jgi:HlyD family type I secretion membrane fusion protein